jgi:subtilisin family serine protease
MILVCMASVAGFAVIPRGDRDGTEIPKVSDRNNGPIPETSTLWFVELSSPPLSEAGPVSEAKYLSKLRQEKQDFRTAARRRGVRFTERYAYDRLWNGVSVDVDPKQLLDLSNTPGVAAIYPVFVVEEPEKALPMDPSSGASLDLFTAITMTGAAQVQESGITGAGVTVGIIDTGIDYMHPDLGAGFGPGFQVEGGFDLVGDNYLGGLPLPDGDPRDCNGHGTHVAGIVAANGVVKGVAPGAHLRAYKIFGCGGGTTGDVILAAMEMALADGVRVVNLSLGNPFQWPTYPTARGADNLVNRGVVVVASAGNSGASGLYAVGTPAVARKAIAVASVENLKVHSHAALVPGGPTIGYLPIRNMLPPPLLGSSLIKDVGRGCSNERALFVGLQGKIAVMQRGRCSLQEKIFNVRGAGAVAALMYNDSPGTFLIGIQSPGIAFPAATMSREDGAYLVARARFPTMLTWTTGFVEVPNAGGGTTSEFSSYGAGPDLDLKPDIAAPGGLIYSTLPLVQGGYGIFSGTSMSSPHVAGTVALLLEAKPHTPSQAVRDILQNSGVPRPWYLNPISGLPEPVERQGAGMVDIFTAIQTPWRISPAKLALGEMEGRSRTRTLVVENKGGTQLELTPVHLAAASTGKKPNDPAIAPGFAEVSFSPETLRVPPGESRSLEVTITGPPELEEGGLFSGFIVLSPADGGRPLRVPYLGMKGDYQHMVALDAAFSAFGNPILSNGFDFLPPAPLTIHPADAEAAYVLFHLAYPVRRIRLNLYEAGGRSHGRLFEGAFIPRNGGEAFAYFLVWAGNDTEGNPLPAGDYTLELSVQKALGEDDNPEHWEIWTSPVVTVVR